MTKIPFWNEIQPYARTLRFRGHEYRKWCIDIGSQPVWVLAGNAPEFRKKDLVFIHGLASDWHVWEKQMNTFRTSYNVYGLGLPWSG